MAIESVTYINSLNESYPAGNEKRKEGDDHIRNIKKAIKQTFPNITGVVNKTHTQLNDTPSTAEELISLLGYTPYSKNGGQIEGSIEATGNIRTLSDERYKSEWQPMPAGFVRNYAQVKNGTYQHKNLEARAAGVSAQSLRKVLPEAVNGNEEEYDHLTIDLCSLFAITVELAKKVVELEDRLNALTS